MTSTPYIVKNDELIGYKGENGQPMADSKTVAEKFGKQHKDVLRAIENLECSDDFLQRNFAPQSVQVRQGRGKGYLREEPMYLMTRDGFSFLVMGFTGKRAAHWKEMYIKAFNAMEQQLKEKEKALRERMRQGLEASHELVELQSETIKELEPKAAWHDEFRNGKGTMTMTEVAKTLDLSGVKLGRWLRENGWIFQRTDKLIPTQWVIDAGYMVQKVWKTRTKNSHTGTHGAFTPKGAQELQRLWKIQLGV